MNRDIVTIDQELCDGCGLCVPACHEGAVRIVDGKARLVSEALCDGLGVCLGHCPCGAIRIERREAMPFDEQAVRDHSTGETHTSSGCPSAQFAQFSRSARVDAPDAGESDERPESPSELAQWPVQLRLLSPNAPILRRARLLVAADCVPVACADFHARLLRGRAVVIACPKLDNTDGYVEKLAEMIRLNGFTEITVAYMEVPCCTGILHAVLEARRRARADIPVDDVVIGIRGQELDRKRIHSEFGVD